MPVADVQHLRDGVYVPLVREVAGNPEGYREVEGPDKDAVYALERAYLVYVLEAAGRLALGQEQRAAVGALHVAREAVGIALGHAQPPSRVGQ